MNQKPNYKFYNTIDRYSTYTVETDLEKSQYYKMLLHFISKHNLTHKRNLEIGSARGLFQDTVENYIGLDVSSKLSHFYHKPYVVASGDHLPFTGESIDGIFSLNTHEHIPNLEEALVEIVRVLKSGG